MMERLQNIVSSDGRFKNLREALRRCDPPCIPYIGMYLSDLSFIEEGTPTVTEDGLLNFSKMRMVNNFFCSNIILRYSLLCISTKRHVKYYNEKYYNISMN